MLHKISKNFRLKKILPQSRESLQSLKFDTFYQNKLKPVHYKPLSGGVLKRMFENNVNLACTAKKFL